MGDGFRVLDIVKPFLPFLPEVQSADRKVPFRGNVIYTVISIFIFSVYSQLPLYGIHSTTGADRFYWYASNRGTVMELGIVPIATSGLVMQFLAGSKIIEVNNNVREDRVLFNGARKLLSILIAVGEAVAYVLSEMYGSVDQLGVGNAILIIIQLCFAGIILICLDELLQKGHGLGSGTSLFIANNVCENTMGKAFSTITSGGGLNLKVLLLASVHHLITDTDKARALHRAFYRQNLPNVTNLLATVLINVIVTYLQGFHVVLPVILKDPPGQQGSYPIKLFYTSNIPVILQSALVSSTCFISQLFSLMLASLLSLLMLAMLLFFCSLVNVTNKPFHALFYLTFMLSHCAFFFQTWVEVSGSSAKDVSKQLKEQNMVMAGHWESNLQPELYQYIQNLQQEIYQ
ncbi:hypothetical protein JCGZ_13468 [Jatropha curcas]|uniref:Translocon Sec61/SecY plug domain-containing protein n=1 Tax=Jatropha curcas TaxID=180498 RepID=A0A067LC89_JATCU|nr:hypothetical protein JCGZ_13468 [Jatropha curcas]